MDVGQFDFDLPDENIALRPARPRHASRLMAVWPDGRMQHGNFSDLTDFLRPGDGLVFNDTRVIPAQFEGRRERDGNIARISVTLHRRLSPEKWAAFAKGAKKLKTGDRISFGSSNDTCFAGELDCVVTEKGTDGEVELSFDLSGVVLDEAMMANGQMPLPPYIASKRNVDGRDAEDYQTVYAANDGAVAAPTAGLHFSDDIFRALEAMDVTTHFITLHVGAGTFLPVKAADTADHRMHFENGSVSAESASAINTIRARGGRVVCVGTTSLRLLESAADETGKILPWSGATDIFITPGYQFRAIDMLITNFHLPRSTLFMLVSAFSGLDTMQNAYAKAIENDYRFYSYGDACLLFGEGAGDS